MPTPGSTKVFVSSVYREPAVAGSEKHLRIRRIIRDLAVDVGVDAWIAEYSAVGLEKEHWTRIVDTCIEHLLDSNVFIAVLYSRAGGAVELDHEFGFSTASVFEIELFYASLRFKPAYFFVVRGYEPEPELDNLIKLLQLKETAGNWFVGSEDEVVAQIKELFGQINRASLPNWILPNFCDWISPSKSFSQVEKEIRSEKLSLVGRFTPRDVADYSPARIAHLLKLAESEASRTGRFSRLWMALRELSKRRPEADAESAQRWLQLAQALPSTAAWLGLHGPLNVGVSAAYQTQNELRRVGALKDNAFPYGAFASESYSMGLNHREPAWQRFRFRVAERLATRHAELNPDHPSGALAIRGSARLRLARLGRPWLVWSALADFRRSYKLRVRRGANNSVLGEALVNWGLAEFAVSRILRYKRSGALDRVRDGVSHLESDVSAARAGFVVSAKRKFADALTEAGQLDEARQQAAEATAVAKQFGLISQLNRISR